MDERSVLILGRDEEQGRVERFLAGPRPAMLLVEGRAGIGKTTVWRYGIEAAERAGFHVLAFRSAEAERFRRCCAGNRAGGRSRAVSSGSERSRS